MSKIYLGKHPEPKFYQFNQFLRMSHMRKHLGLCVKVAVLVIQCFPASGAAVECFGGKYASIQTNDGWTHTEVDSVNGSTVRGYHIFSKGSAAGTFVWSATISTSPSNPGMGTLNGSGQINSVGVRSFALTGSIYVHTDGSADVNWSGNDPMFGIIGGSAHRGGTPCNQVGCFTGTYASLVGLGAFTHAEVSTVTGGSLTGYHIYFDGFTVGTFRWDGTVTPSPGNPQMGILSGSGTINNSGTRTFTLSGSVNVNPNGSAGLNWSGVDPRSGGIGGSGERSLPACLDLVLDAFDWAESDGGADFTYLGNQGKTTLPIPVQFFWAKGEEIADRLPGAAIFSHNIRAGFTGRSPTIEIPEGVFDVPPTNATHVLAIIDPDHIAVESDVDNNWETASLCFEWKENSTIGNFDDKANWSIHKIPNEHNRLCLSGSATIQFMGPGAQFRILSADLDGDWRFNFGVARNLQIARSVLRVKEHFILEPGTKFQAVDGEIFCTQMVKVDKANLTLENATINIAKSFEPSPEHELILTLTPRSIGDTPMIRVAGAFKAGGMLTIKLGESAPGVVFQPKSGDRFRLIEFNPDTKNVDKIFERYRFKDYDPRIPGKPDLFWGLTFREDNSGNHFIELLVLKAPDISFGPPLGKLSYTGKPGLVLVTHGTFSNVDGPYDDAFGSIAEGITEFLKRNKNLDWDISSFDWREYSTGLPANGYLYNPATSAQVGIGIGESLVQWFKWKGFDYKKMHILSHSSGSWLVNRMMQLSVGAVVHTTFFDAFTNPSTKYICQAPLGLGLFGVYCGRFESTLGEGGNPAGFSEHYVDRNPIYNLPGTEAHITHATEFDVTYATISTEPKHTPAFDGYPILEIYTHVLPAHAWPYRWYLETVRDAVIGTLPGASHGGFALSPEFLETAAFPQSIRDEIGRQKQAFANSPGTVTRIVGPDLPSLPTTLQPPKLSTPILMPLSSAKATSGILSVKGNAMVISSPSIAPAPLGAKAATGYEASINLPFKTTHPLLALSVEGQFRYGTNSLLSVSIDGTPIAAFSQFLNGFGPAFTGTIMLNEAMMPGTHTLVFDLISVDPASVVVSGVTFNLDARARISEVHLDGQNLSLQMTGPPGNYALETSNDCRTWLRVTSQNTVETDFAFVVPAVAPPAFFRAVLTSPVLQ